jgi:2-dehydro-3-deoxyphosphogalactonate aldolase
MAAPPSPLLPRPDVRAALRDMPLIAILRGLRPDAAVAIGEALVQAGFRIIEVPLNSPEPFVSIERLARAVPATVLVGAGTVLDPKDVDRVRDAGGRLIVMPHSDREVIARARERALGCTPGVATPTEAFAAIAAGAGALKLFPAVAAREQADAKCPGPPRGEQVPDAVADDDSRVDIGAHPRRGGKE